VTRVGWLKLTIFPLCLMPLARLLWMAVTANMGANPIEVITRATGKWILIFLLVTLAITPLRKLTGQLWLIRLRRMFGLFAFFYGCLHFLTYIWLDQGFDLHSIMKDVYKRPFITAGFTGFVLMIPLAVTSTRKMIQRLGGRRWQRLHRLIYVSATAGAIHFLWLVKKDISRPVEYATILGVLLGYRIVVWVVSLVPARAKRSATTAAVSAD
jgi:sulfoxide reductase heme-binding subunit YedZ